MPALLSLVIVLAILALSATASLYRNRSGEHGELNDDDEPLKPSPIVAPELGVTAPGTDD